MATLSLVFLIGAILLGILRKVNIGLVSFGLSLVLGLMSGATAKTIQAGFPTGLFVTLLGVMMLFSIAQDNKTMELLARRVVALAGKRTYLIPIIVYVFSVVLAAVGPGTVPVMGIMAVFTCSLAAEMKISPVLLSATSVLGAAGGGLTPIAPTGILGLSLAADQGITGIEFPYALNMLIAMTIYFIVIYFVLGGYKMKSNVDVGSMVEKVKFNREQIITLIGMAVLVICVIGLRYDVGLTSFTISMALLLLRVANEKKAISNIPWSTLMMIAGINMLMAMVIGLGGINLLASGLAKLMTPATAPGVLGLTAGIMSFFSSTSGVVMPTLIPTVTGIIENVGGSVSALALLSAITNTASAAGMSPISTGGSMGLAAYSSIAKPTEEEQSKLFIQLFAVSIGGVIVLAIVALTGLYTLFA
jgi:di/tricarboxylate transporter